MRLWNKLQVLVLFLKLVRNPNRTELIFKGVDLVSQDPNQEPLQAIEKAVMQNSGFRSMYNEKYIPDLPDMMFLQTCPENSFGRALHQHMVSNGLSFDLFPRNPADRPIQYLTTRIYQDHDLWHVLFGFGTAVEDELAIQAFGVAQFQSPVALMLIAGGLLHLLGQSPARAVAAFGRITELYALGKRAPFLLSLRLHDFFTKPLHEVRQVCGVM